MQVRGYPDLADAELPVVDERRRRGLDQRHEVGVGGLEAPGVRIVVASSARGRQVMLQLLFGLEMERYS